MSDLPHRALVLGLAVSGEAAALALAARGVEVVVSDRSPDADAGRLLCAGRHKTRMYLRPLPALRRNA